MSAQELPGSSNTGWGSHQTRQKRKASFNVSLCVHTCTLPPFNTLGESVLLVTLVMMSPASPGLINHMPAKAPNSGSTSACQP